jgi:hypothetical protein
MLPRVVLASSGKQMDLELNVLLPQSRVAEEGVMVSVQEWFCRLLDLRQPLWGEVLANGQHKSSPTAKVAC